MWPFTLHVALNSRHVGLVKPFLYFDQGVAMGLNDFRDGKGGEEKFRAEGVDQALVTDALAVNFQTAMPIVAVDQAFIAPIIKGGGAAFPFFADGWLIFKNISKQCMEAALNHLRNITNYFGVC